MVRADAAFDPHQGAVLALVHAPGPIVAAVGLDGPPEQLGGNPAGGERVGQRNDLERPHMAAERIDVGNAGDGA